jgi:hypothetical protein
MENGSVQAVGMIGVAEGPESNERVLFWECAGMGGPLLSAPS